MTYPQVIHTVLVAKGYSRENERMIDTITCIRCHCELDMFGFHKDAIAFEVELWMDGIEPEDGDAICDDCASLLVEDE